MHKELKKAHREMAGTAYVTAGLVLSLTVLLGMARGDADDDLGKAKPDAVEILREPAFEKGVRPPTNGSNREGLGATSLERWQERLSTTTDASWQFVTVAESTRLNDNTDTPTVDGPRITYASIDGSKRLEIDRAEGEVRFVFDTEKEWRHGCNMSLPQDGVEPVFLSGHEWNWPHFLLSQDLEDPHASDNRLRLRDYREAMLTFEAELLDSAKGMPEQCPPGSWGDEPIPDHCLFYTALVMQRIPGKEPPNPDSIAPNRIYALYPLFYSNEGEHYDGPDDPWLGLDPASDAVYFTADHVRLEVGRPVDVAIDVHRLTAESIAAINDRHEAGLQEDDYFIQGLLIGWEKWGSYRTDIRLRNVSFTVRGDSAEDGVS